MPAKPNMQTVAGSGLRGALAKDPSKGVHRLPLRRDGVYVPRGEMGSPLPGAPNSNNPEMGPPVFAGGNPNFDERTGQYTTPPQMDQKALNSALNAARNAPMQRLSPGVYRSAGGGLVTQGGRSLPRPGGSAPTANPSGGSAPSAPSWGNKPLNYPSYDPNSFVNYPSMLNPNGSQRPPSGNEWGQWLGSVPGFGNYQPMQPSGPVYNRNYGSLPPEGTSQFSPGQMNQMQQIPDMRLQIEPGSDQRLFSNNLQQTQPMQPSGPIYNRYRG